MSRSLVFVNANGETLTLGSSGPIMIVTVDGLGTPETLMQEQKAPFQDGTTYIDALLQPRTITVEVAITKPNDFAAIDTYRREMVRKLNPKLGQGTLTYTTENGAQYKIAAIPMSSPAFPNKDYRDPYARAQVMFYCNDPYWKKTTADTIDLPTAATGAESVVNNSYSAAPQMLKLNDGSYVSFYYDTTGTTKTYKRTSADGITWAASAEIGLAAGINAFITQLPDNSFVAVYKKSGAGIVFVTGTNLSTWSAETVVSATATNIFCPIKLLKDGSYICIYTQATTQYIVARKSSTLATWGGEITIYSAIAQASPMSILQDIDGTIRTLYSAATTQYLTMAYSADNGATWASSTINSADTTYAGDIKQRTNGSWIVLYRRQATDQYLVTRYSSDAISWSGESVVSSVVGVNGQFIIESETSVRLFYRRSSDNYFIQSIRSVTPTTATVVGDYKAPFQVSFNGPSTNPRIVNADTLEYIRLNTTLATGDTFTVDTTFGNKTVTLTQGGIVKNGIAFLDVGSTFFQLEPGANVVYFEDDAVASTATATMTWTERYVGT